MTENTLKLRDLVLADDAWTDVIRVYPLLIGEHVLLKVVGKIPVKVESSNSVRPPWRASAETYQPGEGALCWGSAVWVKGKGAHLEVSRVRLT